MTYGDEYHYHCDQNHEIHSRRPLKQCPAMVKGKPCPGQLKRVGNGSRPRTKKAPTPPSTLNGPR